MSKLLSTTDLMSIDDIRKILLEFEDFNVEIYTSGNPDENGMSQFASDVAELAEGKLVSAEEVAQRDDDIKKLLSMMFFVMGVSMRYFPEATVSMASTGLDEE